MADNRPVQNEEECLDALSAALQSIDADLDVYVPILRLIAALVPYCKRGGVAFVSQHRAGLGAHS